MDGWRPLRETRNGEAEKVGVFVGRFIAGYTL